MLRVLFFAAIKNLTKSFVNTNPEECFIKLATIIKVGRPQLLKDRGPRPIVINFFDHNLRTFVIIQSICSWQAFTAYSHNNDYRFVASMGEMAEWRQKSDKIQIQISVSSIRYKAIESQKIPSDMDFEINKYV